MITVIFSLICSGLIFASASLFGVHLWFYFVPTALIIALLMLRSFHSRAKRIAEHLAKKYPDVIGDEIDKDIFLASPALFTNRLQLFSAFTRYDFSSSIGYILLIGVVYAICSLVKLNWISVLLCAFAIYDSIFGKIASSFETADNDGNVFRAVRRYLKYKNKNIKNVSDIELCNLAERYPEIVNRLDAWNSKDDNAPDV